MTSSRNKMVAPSFKTEERTRSYYRWRAEGYDKVTAYEIEHHREAIQLADVQPGDQVLEVACGTGRATVELAGLLSHKGKLNAMDLSEEMLARARQKLKESGLLDCVEFKVGSALKLPYPDRSFDLIYNSYMFDLMAETQFNPILHEFKRALKPGGKLVLVNMSKNTSRKTLYEMVYELLRLFPCRPVMMENYLLETGFINVKRMYRQSFNQNLLLPFGTEIVTARNN